MQIVNSTVQTALLNEASVINETIDTVLRSDNELEKYDEIGRAHV